MNHNITVTHDGVFHADDVFAGAMVRRLWPDKEIVRTRDPQMIADAFLAFDVGGGPLDHHQRDFSQARPNGIPYAAAGLLWRLYGEQLCDGSQEVADEVDRQLIQSIDAHDNGVRVAEPTMDVIVCTVSHIISNFNPSWNEPQDFDRCYSHAVDFAQAILDRAINRAIGVISARALVAQAVQEADDPRIVVLDRFVPWQEALIDASDAALFIVYPSAGSWRVQVVPVVPGAPGARRPLPTEWAGLDGPALAACTGVADATFVHRGRFIAGATSQAGALALARLALG